MKYLTINNIPDDLCFWNIQRNLDEHTLLHYIEITDYNDHDHISSFTASILFYDCQYFVEITPIALKQDYPTLYLEGPSILFSSCNEHLEEECWEVLKELCKRLLERLCKRLSEVC